MVLYFILETLAKITEKMIRNLFGEPATILKIRLFTVLPTSLFGGRPKTQHIHREIYIALEPGKANISFLYLGSFPSLSSH